MARKLVWPLPPEKEDTRPPWYTLSPDQKVEDLKERTDGQDKRLAHLESLLRLCVKLFWIVLSAFIAVCVKEYVSSYQLVRTNQVVLPAPNGTATTAPDYPKTFSKP